MKKTFVFVVLALALLVSMFGGHVSTVRAEGLESITLIGAQAISHKGVVFIFHVVGDFKSYSGTVRIGVNSYALTNCRMTDANTRQVLKCTAEQGLMPYINQWATVTINGFTSSALIRPVGQICYVVAEERRTGSVGALAFPSYIRLGSYCQKGPGKYGDIINYMASDGHIHQFVFYAANDPNIPDSFYDKWLGPGYYGPIDG